MVSVARGLRYESLTAIDIAGDILIIGDISIDVSEIIGGSANVIQRTEKADKIKETLDGATIRTLGGNDIIRSYGDAYKISGTKLIKS